MPGQATEAQLSHPSAARLTLLLCRRCSADFVSEVLCVFAGFSALHVAVPAGQRQAVLALCEAGADVITRDDTEGRAPRHPAVERRHLETCQPLLRPALQYVLCCRNTRCH